MEKDFTTRVENGRLIFSYSYRNEFGETVSVGSTITKEKLVEIIESAKCALAKVSDDNSNCNIPHVSTRIDFKKLREAYFNEHVSHKTTDGIPVVCTHPHNLFEWFKAELAEYGC